MKITYINRMGSDMTVVNAARASLDKETMALIPNDSDIALLKFLARGYDTASWGRLINKFIRETNPIAMQKLMWDFKRHQTHFVPFAHPQLSIRITAPLCVARQLWKSHVGVVGGDCGYPAWSEQSRRYLDDKPVMDMPNKWRTRAASLKQGSGDSYVPDRDLPDTSKVVEISTETYCTMIDAGVAPEQARMVLLGALEVTWIWTGSLMFFARVCYLREDPHAQAEARECAAIIAEMLHKYWPVSASVLLTGEFDGS